MMNEVVPAGGQGAVEFDDSAAANAVESRLSLVRTLVEDMLRSGENGFHQEITVDNKVWSVRVEPTSR